MTCPICGANNEDSSLFCISCGNRLDTDRSANADDSFVANERNDDLTIAFDEESDTLTSFIGDEDEAKEDVLSDGKEEGTTDEDYTGTEEVFEDSEEMQSAGSQFPDESSEEAVQEALAGDEELSEEIPETADPAAHNSNDKLSLAIVLLSAALFAIIGFLFIDKILSLKPSDSRASTIRIISQSEDVTVKPGTLTQFFVDAQGTNLTYQWYVKKNGEQLWHAWKSHNDFKTASKANESWDGMQVYCMITDNNRTAIASDIITVTIEK